jgi:hypothetical protein
MVVLKALCKTDDQSGVSEKEARRSGDDTKCGKGGKMIVRVLLMLHSVK